MRRLSSDSNASTGVMEYDSASNTYHTVLEWTTHDPSIAVVELFARLLDVDPVDIEPLSDSIDPAALDALLQGQQTRFRAGDCTVAFTYLEHRVTVSSDGSVEIEPPTDPESGDRPAETDSRGRDDVDRAESAACEATAETDRDGGGNENENGNENGDGDGDGDLPRAG